MTEPVVRLATEADIPSLVEMRYAFTAEDCPQGTELDPGFAESGAAFLRDALASGRWAVWVAELGGQVVSTFFVELVDKVPRPAREPRQWGYLTNVYARPEYRGRGIGGAVLERVKSWAAAGELEFVIVWPSEESVELYVRHGFAPATEPMVWTPESP